MPRSPEFVTTTRSADMPLKFHWFLPTQGDGRGLIETGDAPPAGVAGGLREASIAYLTQVATAAEALGFEAALTPTGGWCDDAWVVTAMLAETSERLKFLIAFRPGLAAASGADGGALPVALAGAPPPQRGDRRRRRRTACLRGFPREGGALP